MMEFGDQYEQRQNQPAEAGEQQQEHSGAEGACNNHLGSSSLL
jgi:hypothetical protein